jgi:hypothetical protein
MASGSWQQLLVLDKSAEHDLHDIADLEVFNVLFNQLRGI